MRPTSASTCSWKKGVDIRVSFDGLPINHGN
jgi:hypothetical protein